MSAEQPTINPNDKRPFFYSGFITLLLRESYLDGDMLDQVGDEGELADLVNYLSEEGFFMPVRLIQGVDPYRILDLEEAAKDSPYPPLRSLNQYWVLDARGRQEELEKIAIMLPDMFPIVAYAYPEQAAYEPLNNALNEPLFPEQTYLQAGPVGINALWVWENLGFGEGVNLVDLEQNWDLNHVEFADKPPQLEPLSLLNDADPQHEKHGTAVLGILCAGINNQGGVGIAPSLDYLWALSHYREVDDPRNPGGKIKKNGQVAAAIGALLDNGYISPGDVLLLEIERGAGVPTETELSDLDAIRLAVSNDIIVVEAAGNAGYNLDTYQRFLANERFLNPNFETEFEDSGAILVGASAPNLSPGGNLQHPRWANSNYGSRLNCFAWGTGVATVGFDAAGQERFGETSGAAAIIAGAALLLQSAHKTIVKAALKPDDMRAWLSDPATGTPQLPNAAEPIGVMPDLEVIITSRLP
ncbi:MAG: S8 family serine peptidase [Chloroflexi bacterium]|nr:S8 family serine peptidase [bacterium]MBP7045904.1 S8 family serine peptidase [Chloroflexota bacterium]